jgi:hypothetical protein
MKYWSVSSSETTASSMLYARDMQTPLRSLKLSQNGRILAALIKQTRFESGGTEIEDQILTTIEGYRPV